MTLIRCGAVPCPRFRSVYATLCRQCWQSVPEPLRKEIWRYHHDPNRRGSRAHVEAMRRAVAIASEGAKVKA